jgi:hypothetical protein
LTFNCDLDLGGSNPIIVLFTSIMVITCAKLLQKNFSGFKFLSNEADINVYRQQRDRQAEAILIIPPGFAFFQLYNAV